MGQESISTRLRFLFSCGHRGLNAKGNMFWERHLYKRYKNPVEKASIIIFISRWLYQTLVCCYQLAVRIIFINNNFQNVVFFIFTSGLIFLVSAWKISGKKKWKQIKAWNSWEMFLSDSKPQKPIHTSVEMNVAVYVFNAKQPLSVALFIVHWLIVYWTSCSIAASTSQYLHRWFSNEKNMHGSWSRNVLSLM